MWDLAGQVRNTFRPLDPDQGLIETMSLIERAHKQWKREAARDERAELAEYLDEVQGRTAAAGACTTSPSATACVGGGPGG